MNNWFRENGKTFWQWENFLAYRQIYLSVCQEAKCALETEEQYGLHADATKLAI